MRRKPWLTMLVCVSVLVLVAAHGACGASDEAVPETEKSSALNGEPPPPPDLDVLPGKGGGSGGGGGDKEAADQKEELLTEEALAELKTKWKFGLLSGDKGPPSKGKINKKMLSEVTKLLGLAKGDKTGKNIKEFSIEVSKKTGSTVETRTIRAQLGANKRITWYLEPAKKPLEPREPDSELQLPEEFFWESTTITVIDEDGKPGEVEKVHIDWKGN